MPYNGSGSFSTKYNWQNDAALGLNISSSRMQGQDQDMAAGLSLCLTKDGQQTPVANIPMGGFRIINLGAPTNGTDAAQMAWVQAQIATLAPYGVLPVVSSMTAIQALDKTKATQVFALGYYENGDGGGGPYFKAYDTAPAGWQNGGTQIVSTDGAGWQLAIQSGPLSPLQFGAIADGNYHALSEKYSTLAAAQAVYPNAVALTDAIDYVAAMAASQALLAFSAQFRTLAFPESRTCNFYQNMPDVSSFVNVVWELNQGTLQFNRQSLSTNLMQATTPNGFCIQNGTIAGGQISGSGSGQGLSFQSPRNCRLTNIKFTDCLGFSVLWYDNTRTNNTVNTNNVLDNCSMDGGNVASCAFIFVNLSKSFMYRPKAYNMSPTITAGSTGYVLDLKDTCQDCEILDGEVSGGYIAFACTDDGASTTGIGANNCVIRGVARNCYQALLANKVVNLTADIKAYSCGNAAASMSVIQAAGYNSQSVYNVEIFNVNTGATVLASRSDDQIFNVKFWDWSGALFMDWSTAGTDRNQVNIANNIRYSSRTTNIWTLVTVDPAASLNNQIRFVEDTQDLAYNTTTLAYSVSWYPLIPGVARTNIGLTFASNGTIFYVRMGGANVLQHNITSLFFAPGADNTTSCGTSAYRFSQFYAGTGTINTSDAREKQQIRTLSDSEKAVAVALKGLMRMFKFNDAVTKKGAAARWHAGVMAQDVQAAFTAQGLDGMTYGVLCYDEWPDQYEEVLDANGDPTGETKLVLAAGNRYGVRYEELFAFVISAL
jgi:hypothetical protein